MIKTHIIHFQEGSNNLKNINMRIIVPTLKKKLLGLWQIILTLK